MTWQSRETPRLCESAVATHRHCEYLHSECEGDAWQSRKIERTLRDYFVVATLFLAKT